MSTRLVNSLQSPRSTRPHPVPTVFSEVPQSVSTVSTVCRRGGALSVWSVRATSTVCTVCKVYPVHAASALHPDCEELSRVSRVSTVAALSAMCVVATVPKFSPMSTSPGFSTLSKLYGGSSETPVSTLLGMSSVSLVFAVP